MPADTAIEQPMTPHAIQALGPLTPSAAAEVMGCERTFIHRRIASGEMPTTSILGSTRIQPLVVWAAMQGANKVTLQAVARALLQGKSVDEIVRLVGELVEAQPPPVRKRRGVKKAVTP